MGRNYAITIGINEYRYLQRLNYAKHDADAVRQLFLQELGFQQVYHFTDDSPDIPQDYGPDLKSHPTAATLERFLRTRFAQPFLRDGDNLWFFFAGYGIRHQNRYYLMPMDGDRGNLERSAIPIHYISERLLHSGADNVILLIDARQLGGKRDSYGIGIEKQLGKRDGYGIGIEKQQGVISFFSCSPEESSYEIEELGQGAFTYVLIESLRRQGEGNCATVQRLYQQLRYDVPRLTWQYKRVNQTPYGVIEPPTKYHLILLPQSATLADVVTLKNDALRAEIQKDFKQAKQYWVRVLAASPADPEAIEGIERLSRLGVAASLPAPQQVNPTELRINRESRRKRSFTEPAIKLDLMLRINRESKRKQCFTEPAIQLDLMLIPGGTFTMGSPEDELGRYNDEGPQHDVTVPTFLMGRYPVTQAQWRTIATRTDLKVNIDLDPDPSEFKGEDCPVEQVSWHEAVEFCQRLSRLTGHTYRLPTEAEWEYACRAGTATPFHFGETITTDLANYRGEEDEDDPEDYPGNYGNGPKGVYRQETTPVNYFHRLANAFGLCDLHGNVWEWCLDYWHDNYEGAPTDGSAWLTEDEEANRVLRGGSWNISPWYCRSACRDFLDPGDRNYNLGFRVICEAQDS